MIAPIQNSATAKLLVTMAEAGEMISCCERTIGRLVERGELRAIKIDMLSALASMGEGNRIDGKR